MFASTAHTHHANARDYVTNVASAASAFVAALLAFKPQRALVLAPAISPRAMAEKRYAMFRMADQWQSLSPSLATELRFMAGRD